MKRLVLTVVMAIAIAPLAEAYTRCETCPRDKMGRIERSATAKAEFKRLRLCPATGKSRGACPGYVIDHIQPLCAGGADSPENMQWQTIAAAKEKDREEIRQCH